MTTFILAENQKQKNSERHVHRFHFNKVSLQLVALKISVKI